MGISIGLVGLGQFGVAFADMFMNHPLVDRIALCDREPERMEPFAAKPLWRKKLNRRDRYASFDEIVKTDLDALVIITQPWLHAPQAVAAMQAGKHVYSAVPVISLPDGDEMLQWCDRIIDTCTKTGMHYMLGETGYYRANACFCRRKAREGAFGDFVYAEGEYFHDVDNPGCSLRDVYNERTSSTSGKEWLAVRSKYDDDSVMGGPMHYPTHSTCGPVCVMNAHATRVTGYGYHNRTNDTFFGENGISNEVALFEMSNGATVRIAEFRECAGAFGREDETFRVMGTAGSYSEGKWTCNHRNTPPARKDQFESMMLEEDQMREPLPPEVTEAFREACGQTDNTTDFVWSGHGGSHPYLVHEFVDAVASNRTPAINAWEAARYMAMGVTAHKSALRDGERLPVPDWGDAPR